MKKFLNLTVWLIIVCTFYWACKKDQTTSNKNLTTEEQELISNAKTFFENNVQNKSPNESKKLIELSGIRNGQFNPLKSLFKNALWNSAYILKLPACKVVVVPIKFDDSLYARPSGADSTTRLSINNLSKLIVYYDSAKQMHAEVVSSSPDEKFIKNSYGIYSGVALIQDWQGIFLKAYQYDSSGVMLLSASDSLSASSQTTLSVAKPDLLAPPSYVQTCTYMDWYEFNGENYTLDHTQSLGCTIQKINNSEPGETLSVIEYGIIAGNGGGPGVTPNPNTPNVVLLDTIGNNLKDSCFSKVLTTLEQKVLRNEITNMLLNIFGVSDSINVVFQEQPFISGDSNADADTKPAQGSGTQKTFAHYDIITTLSDQQLVNASKEFIAETMFHEIIHGYLDANNSPEKELSQHITMINSYVNCESSALQEVFPNLSKHDAQCLVIGGFGQVQQYDSTIFNAALSSFKLNLNDIVHTDSSYKYGSKGSPCNLSSQ